MSSHPPPTPHSALSLSCPQLLYPMLVLATLASVVASQALISGVFAIVRQVGAVYVALCGYGL